MYTEIVKIIEGGLAGDKEKVSNYANMLATNLEKQGELALANKIRSILANKKGTFTSLDSFSTRPVDTESRMEVVEITTPQISKSQIVLNKYIEEEIDWFIKSYRHREDFLKVGIGLSNSLLLYGPPGCGKTMLAQYISTITKLPLITARLDGLVSSLLGSTAKNIRKVFDYAARRECILFLDEFDVIAKLRDDKNELGELKRIVNSLIQNIDSFNDSSILIAATNHHKLLDPAIWRRFSKVITLEKPSKEDIGRLLKIYFDGIKTNILNNERRMQQLQIAFEGYSHSNIKTVITNTIKDSIIRNKGIITGCDILRELYFHKNHAIENEDELISYLLRNNIPHKEIHESIKIPLRKIQAISKSEQGVEIDEQ